MKASSADEMKPAFSPRVFCPALPCIWLWDQAGTLGCRGNGGLCRVSFQGDFLVPFLAIAVMCAGTQTRAWGYDRRQLHMASLAFFSGTERESGFLALLRMRLETRAPGLPSNGREGMQRWALWLGHV